VIGNFNNWNHKDHILFPRWDESGSGKDSLKDLPGGLYINMRLKPRGEILEKSDPYALSWEQNKQAASLVSTTWYEWNDREWMENRWKNNNLDAPISVYELHLGSWVKKVMIQTVF
jgi:1,4-alpha-glucan branching enzyme